MKHTHHNILILLILLIIIPVSIRAEQISIYSDEPELKEILSSIPCIELSDNAPVRIYLEKNGGIHIIKDDAGESYQASSIEDALKGYLGLKGICVVEDIVIKGHSRISVDAIRYRIKTSRGDILDKNNIKRDIEDIYAMGYFEKCDASFDKDVLTFEITEYPVIVSIEVTGNETIKTEDIKEAIGLNRFDILNTKILKTSIDRIKAIYREKGFYEIDVNSSQKDTEGGINLIFEIREKTELYIEKIGFDGNKDIMKSSILHRMNNLFTLITPFPKRRIYAEDLLSQMETSKRCFFGLFNSGAYMEDGLDNDLSRIEQYYADKGYIKARVGRPIVDIKPDEGIFITIPIEPGPLYYIGDVDVSGDLILPKRIKWDLLDRLLYIAGKKPKKGLLDTISLKKGDLMSKTSVHAAIERVRDVYMDKAYANVRIAPVTKEATDNTIDIEFRIKKGSPVDIDMIYIRGNTKTRDKVIRREIKLDEGDLFSSTDLKSSRARLDRLGYFSSVNIEPVPKDEDSVSLLVDVEEQMTGAFQFGIAYSTVDKLIGNVQLSENNLLGLGLKAKLGVEYGGQKKSYTVDLEDPWIFDRNISLGTRLYNTERELTYYTKESRGGNIRLSYPLVEEVRHYIAYSYEDVLPLTDIDSSYREVLSEDTIDGGITSSITNTIYRKTTNDYFRPTRGSDSNLSFEYAGLGGDYHFTRVTAHIAQFFPVYKDSVALMIKLRWGTINGAMGDEIPDYELFTLGGLNSIRGFKYGEVGPMDNYGNVIGGRKEVIANTELTFPIGKVPGLYGVFFLDQGNAYGKHIDLNNIKRSYGAGIRWVTPMGPLRLEYGRVIDPKPYESESRWDFSIGTFF